MSIDELNDEMVRSMSVGAAFTDYVCGEASLACLLYVIPSFVSRISYL